MASMALATALSGCGPPVKPRIAAAAVEPMRHALDVVTQAGPLRLSYLSAGAADDAARGEGKRVVLVHGTPGAATMWADYVAEPPPGLRVVALDRPGFGQTVPAEPMPRLHDQVAALAALLPEGRRSILLGHSLGGPIVALAAAVHPDRVAAIVLLAAALDPALERIHPLQPVGEWWPVRLLLPTHLRNANVELMALKADLEALAADLASVRCPVVIVHGSADDLVPIANVPYMQRHLVGASVVETVVLDGADHFLPWNAVETVRRAIDRAAELAWAR